MIFVQSQPGRPCATHSQLSSDLLSSFSSRSQRSSCFSQLSLSLDDVQFHAAIVFIIIGKERSFKAKEVLRRNTGDLVSTPKPCSSSRMTDFFSASIPLFCVTTLHGLWTRESPTKGLGRTLLASRERLLPTSEGPPTKKKASLVVYQKW